MKGWISTELRKIGRGHDPAKLALPHQANRVDHDDLFSGKFTGPAYSPPRLWRKSPQIYSRFASEMRIKVSQPLLGLGGKEIQDYASLFADEPTIKTMMSNSNLIAEHMVSPERSHMNRHLNGMFKDGAGTMLDNTVIVFLSDAGSQYHTGYENMPLMVLGNMNGAFKTGRYLHYPNSNQSGHRVLANLLMSLQHGAGMPVDDYGDRDLGLSEAIDQRGPLAELMA